MYDGQYPIIVGYVGLIIVILCVGWILTRRIEDERKRIFWRSGVLAVAFAPGFFGAGHGGAIIPALLAAILVILHAEWSTPGLPGGLLPLRDRPDPRNVARQLSCVAGCGAIQTYRVRRYR